MKYLIITCSLAVLLNACNEQRNPESTGGVTLSNSQEGMVSYQKMKESGGVQQRVSSKEHNGIVYAVDVMNAVEFLSGKGEQIPLEDRLKLSKESVAILTIDLNSNKETSVFESARITMDKDDALSYLVGAISTDVTIEQDKKEYTPTGVQYDSGVSEPDKLKVFLFFKEIHSDQPMSFVYYDRLFGSGLLRFKIIN